MLKRSLSRLDEFSIAIIISLLFCLFLIFKERSGINFHLFEKVKGIEREVRIFALSGIKGN